MLRASKIGGIIHGAETNQAIANAIRFALCFGWLVSGIVVGWFFRGELNPSTIAGANGPIRVLMISAIISHWSIVICAVLQHRHKSATIIRP